MHLTLGTAPLLVIGGGLLFQAFHVLVAARSSLRQPGARWWLAFVLGALVFVIARWFQRAATDPMIGYLGSRAQFALGLCFPLIGIGAIEAHLGHRRASPALRAITIAAIGLAIVCLATDWILTAHPEPRIDVLGEEYFATTVGPGGIALTALWIAMATLAVIRVRAMGDNDRSLRRQIRISAIGFVVVGVNDTLLAAGLIQSLHLFEYMLALPCALSAVQMIRRSEHTQADLADAVAARTAALEQTGAALEHALDDLRTSERRFQQLADASREGVATIAGERVMDTNRALRDMFRLAADASPEVALDQLFGPGDLDAVRGILASAGERLVTVTARRRDGSSFAVEVSTPAEAALGAGTKVLLVRDVTVQQELQRQILRSDRLAAMGTLAASTAHEINNPLTYVLSNAQLLADELTSDPATLVDDPEHVRALVGDIVEGAERVRRIVKDMVAVSRDRATLDTAVDLRAVIRDSLAMVSHQLRHRAIVEVVGDDQVPLVRGDEVRLSQVFVNLMINASQAIPEGRADGNRVTIAVRVEGAAYAVVRISDTGIGMTPAVRDRIFDPFFTTKDVGEGTGLGLAVSLGIVSALGGRIEVESEIGVGSTFSVWLPLAARDDQPAPTEALAEPPAVPPEPAADAAPETAPAEPGPPPAAVTLARGRVLIVDDEAVVARTFARILAKHETVVASSGREAIALCRDQTFAAIVCDLMMPDVTGMEVHEALAATRPALAARMIFVTGGVFTERARAFAAAVPNRILSKPVTADDLRAAVAAIEARATI